MKKVILTATLVLAATACAATAQPVRWTTYAIPETGTAVDFPASIFTEQSSKPDGYGQRFRPRRPSDITVQAAPNVSNDSPAAFLANKRPPAQIQYKRVTSRFSRSRATRATGSGTTAAIFPAAWSTACSSTIRPAKSATGTDRDPDKPIASWRLAASGTVIAPEVARRAAVS